MINYDNGMTIYDISKSISSTISFLTGQILELQYLVKFLKKSLTWNAFHRIYFRKTPNGGS
jgi:hypothetical protein